MEIPGIRNLRHRPKRTPHERNNQSMAPARGAMVVCGHDRNRQTRRSLLDATHARTRHEGAPRSSSEMGSKHKTTLHNKKIHQTSRNSSEKGKRKVPEPSHGSRKRHIHTHRTIHGGNRTNRSRGERRTAASTTTPRAAAAAKTTSTAP